MKVSDKWWVGVPIRCGGISYGAACGVVVTLEDEDAVTYVPDKPSYGFGNRELDRIVVRCPVCKLELSLMRKDATRAEEAA